MHELDRRCIDPGYFGAQPAPIFGQPPKIGGQPGDPGFGENDAQIRELAEHAFADQAGELRLERNRLCGIIFAIIRCPAH